MKRFLPFGISAVMAVVAFMFFPFGKIFAGIILLCGLGSLKSAFSTKNK